MAEVSKPHESSKRALIDKSNAKIVIAISISIFVVIFSAFAVKALIGQAGYQQNVIDGKKEALKIAEQNKKNAQNLEKSYIAFEAQVVNVLGGNPEGEGPLDGSNPKIVLDSLPSVYDYPALSSSIEKLLLDNGYEIESIGGADDVALVGTDTPAAGGTTQTTVSAPIEVPYPISVQSSTEGTKQLLSILERSIRPFYVDSISFAGSGDALSTTITMKTFYQPGTGVTVTTKAVQ
jgi:hypothetical protein